MVNFLREQRSNLAIRCHPRVLAVVWVVLSAMGSQQDSFAASFPVELTRLDGTIVTADWLGCQNDGTIKVSMESAQHQVPWHDLIHLAFHEDAVDPKPATPARFFLPAGGMFRGVVTASDEDAVKAETNYAGGLTIPFDALAGLAIADAADYVQANTMFHKVLAARQAGSDVLITRSIDNVKTLRGRLVEFGPDGCAFEFAGRTRTLGIDKIFGVVFAAGTEIINPVEATFELVDGSSFAAKPVACDDDYFELDTTFAGRLRIKADQIRGVSVNSPRLVYLSDLTILQHRSEGMLHGDWPIQFDKNVTGGELSMAGHVFRRGVGVHSLSELKYDIAAAFETFVAVIGIDDAVRPRGDVVFQVLGDDRVLFDSGPITGRDAARDVRVDVLGVNELTLRVNFGAGLDLADHADWADARLIRPAKTQLPRTTTQ